MGAADIEVRVHDHSDVRLRAMTRLIELASQRRPLPRILRAMCEETSVVLGAEVVSVFLREGDPLNREPDELVMRGNLGLSGTVVDQVRLPMGRGVVGLAAESARAVSRGAATDEGSARSASEIGEERYPAYCAVPMSIGCRVVGVVELQRRRAFTDGEIVLATAAASIFTFAVERASVRRRRIRPKAPRNRSVRLTGMPVVWGSALGVAQALPSFDSISEIEGESLDVEGLGEAWTDLLKELSRGRRKRAPGTRDDELESILVDGRLSHALVSACAGMGPAKGARHVAAKYALTPERLREADERTAELLSRRAREVADLCLLFAAAVAPGPRILAGRGSVLLIPESPTRVLTLMALCRGVGAVLIGGPVESSDPALALLAAADVPVISELAQMFTWIEAGDRILVDGTTGRIRVHPTPIEVVRARRGKKNRASLRTRG